jgi:hypothetical protein
MAAAKPRAAGGGSRGWRVRRSRTRPGLCVRERIWESRRLGGVEVTLLLPASEVRPGLGEELTVAARRWSQVVDKTRRIDSRMISAVGRRMTVLVFVLYVLTVAAGLIVIRLSRGTHGPWVETVGPTLTCATPKDGRAATRSNPGRLYRC